MRAWGGFPVKIKYSVCLTIRQLHVLIKEVVIPFGARRLKNTTKGTFMQILVGNNCYLGIRLCKNTELIFHFSFCFLC